MTEEWIRYHAEREHDLIAENHRLAERERDLLAERDVYRHLLQLSLAQTHSLTVKLQRTNDLLRCRQERDA